MIIHFHFHNFRSKSKHKFERGSSFIEGNTEVTANSLSVDDKIIHYNRALLHFSTAHFSLSIRRAFTLSPFLFRFFSFIFYYSLFIIIASLCY